MPPPINRDEVLELLFKSELDVLDEATLARVLDVTEPDTSPTDTLRPLVLSGVLTQWQADRLAEGKWKRFRYGQYRVLGVYPDRAKGQRVAAGLSDNQQMELILLPSWMAEFAVLAKAQQQLHELAKLSHRNIVKILDVFCHEGVHVVVLEARVGPFIAELLEQGRLPIGEACGCALQVAAGLQYLHTVGVVHGDLSPWVVQCSPAGAVKISDTAFKRLLDESTYGFDSFPGPPTNHDGIPYLAPERWHMNGADCRDDIYSLGAILYHLLTGQTPFDGDSVARMGIAIVGPRPAIPATARRQEVPAELSRLIAKMMAKKPEDRYQSISEVVAALRPFVVPSATRTCPPMAAAALAQLA